MSWNSEQYLKFKTERTQPAIDLASRIPVQSPADIIDIGCGPGNSTDILKKRYPNAAVVGADNSENMLEAARGNYTDIEFILCDASKELKNIGRKFDVVFSNACIQWVPDHPKLLREMMSLLKEGGALAVQIPMNYDEPIHRIIGEAVKSEKWRDKFAWSGAVLPSQSWTHSCWSYPHWSQACTDTRCQTRNRRNLLPKYVQATVIWCVSAPPG